MTCHIPLDILHCNPIESIKNEFFDQNMTSTFACYDEKITLAGEESTARSKMTDPISKKNEKTSIIWEYFNTTTSRKAFICKLCERKVIASARNDKAKLRSSNLWRHLRVQHPAPYN